MTNLNLAAYAADVAILLTYFRVATTGQTKSFHLANAVGCIPLICVEVASGAWAVIPVTATFGIVGAFGYMKRVTHDDATRGVGRVRRDAQRSE